MQGGVMEFDNERALLLIELYRRHRSLWDPKDPLYYSKARKAQAWAEVSARVGGPVPEVRRKMESLLGSFRRERSRAARAAARGLRKSYTSSWFAYDKMKFLIDRDNPKKPKRLRSDNALEAAEGGAGAEAEAAGAEPFLEGLHAAFGDALLEAVAADEEQEEVQLDVKPAPARLAPAWTSPPHDSWRPRRSSSKSALEGSHVDEEEPEDFGARAVVLSDEAAVFGQYVAEKLRRYSPRARCVVEHLVSNVLFEADMGAHDAPQERSGGGARLRAGGAAPVVVTYRPPSASPSPPRPASEDGEDDEDGAPAVKLEPEILDEDEEADL